jgi:hypothetical protein
MGAYVMWLEEEGLDMSMKHVARYHKENPHMIPPDKTVCTFPIKEKDDKEEED